MLICLDPNPHPNNKPREDPLQNRKKLNSIFSQTSTELAQAQRVTVPLIRLPHASVNQVSRSGCT
ncbi:hypothetical protein CUMW_111170 [Citrus unshiu]|nr:hypothetical protein CUMW_111170 [Citrus unshiu]GAY48373.1 hypothetical protein CUMW_111170 [Citrus unshiu]GAY48374.1 hypothetical protein CUMW_111170 [Citrus unshiu]